MNVKKIGKTPVILLIAMLTISTVTLTLLPPAAADVYQSGVTNYPWSLGGHDNARTGTTAALAPQKNYTSWIYDTGDPVRSGAAIVDGVVYIGSCDDQLYALDMVTGAKYWNYTTGDDVRSVPCVYDGKVYFGSNDDKLYCLSAGKLGGAFQWSYTTSGDVYSSPAVANNGTMDLVVFGSRDFTVNCLDTSGNLVWSMGTGDDVRGGPAIVDGKVYIGSDSNWVYCYNLTDGTLLWSDNAGSDTYQEPVVDGDVVYFGIKGKDAVYAYGKDNGTYLGLYKVGDDIRGGMAIANGKMVVAGTADGVVYCFDLATNTTDWTYSTKVADNYNIPVIADGNAYFTAETGIIYAIDMATGNEVWTYYTTGGSSSDWAVPAVADGRLIIGSGDGNVYCFGYRGLFMEGSGQSIIDEYNVCENFTVDIKVENITGLYSEYVAIQWDPTYLYCNSFDYVDDFIPDQAPAPGSYLDIAGSINNTGGYTTVYSRTLTGGTNAGGVNGTGVLFQAEFHVEDYCPDGTTISFTDETELLAYGAVTIDVPMQTFYFELNYPPPSAPVACFTESAPPYFVNETWISFDASCSTPGNNGTQNIPIANYTWDFDDGNVTTVTGTTITHMYTTAGLFNVTLTVMCEDDPILIGPPDLTSNTSAPQMKNVIVRPPGAAIDLYTEIYRFQEPPTDWIGEGTGYPADAYRPDENVTLYVNLTYNGDAVQSRLISFEVRDPHGDIVLVRTAMTNSTGTATISFRIETVCGNPEYAFGKWSVLAKTTVCDIPINDTLQFDVGWIITLDEVVPASGTFKKGEHMTFYVYGENMALHAKNFTLTLVVYDNDGVPVSNIVVDTQVPAGEPCEPNPFEIEVTCLEVPKWAYVGPATVYANAFYSLPSDCGVSMCPEISGFFNIAMA